LYHLINYLYFIYLYIFLNVFEIISYKQLILEGKENINYTKRHCSLSVSSISNLMDHRYKI